MAMNPPAKDKTVVVRAPREVVVAVPQDASVLDRFLKITGFEQSDIQGWNSDTKIFSTIQGQKFQMRGRDIRKLTGGGSYPKEVVFTNEKPDVEGEEK